MRFRLSTTAAGFAISTAFFALFSRRRVHGTRVIAFRLPSAIGARHFIRIHFHQFLKAFSTRFTFVLQKRHFF